MQARTRVNAGTSRRCGPHPVTFSCAPRPHGLMQNEADTRSIESMRRKAMSNQQKDPSRSDTTTPPTSKSGASAARARL